MANDHAVPFGKKITQIDWAPRGRDHARDAHRCRKGRARRRIHFAPPSLQGVSPSPRTSITQALDPEGVGDGLRTKVNVNLGISGDLADGAEEWRKVEVALELGAEGIMGPVQTTARRARSAAPLVGAFERDDRHGADVRRGGFSRQGPRVHHGRRLPRRRARACRGRRGLRDHPARASTARQVESFLETGPPHEHREPWRRAAVRLDACDGQREPVLRTLRRPARDPA